jgi:hypothetical protein
MFSHCTFERSDLLDKFVSQVKSQLFDQGNVHEFVFPADCQKFIIENGDDLSEQVTTLNEALLDAIAGKDGVYSLTLRKSSQENWDFMYVGHTDGKYSRSRIRNHLIKKHEKTGAQLENIRKSVCSGYIVGVSFVKITPRALRLLAEERIIATEKDLKWNIKGRS